MKIRSAFLSHLQVPLVQAPQLGLPAACIFMFLVVMKSGTIIFSWLNLAVFRLRRDGQHKKNNVSWLEQNDTGSVTVCNLSHPPFPDPYHTEFFWVTGFSISHLQMHKRYIRRIRTRDLMISSRRMLSPLDYRTVAAEAIENIWYLCTLAGPDPDPDAKPRGGGQQPNPKSAILR